jgi:hypothetical protein
MYFLAPASTVVTSLLGFVAYLLGVRQGRSQAQYEESIKVLVELRQQTLRAASLAQAWAVMITSPYTDIDRFFENARGQGAAEFYERQVTYVPSSRPIPPCSDPRPSGR